jgi:hypothetical protein
MKSLIHGIVIVFVIIALSLVSIPTGHASGTKGAASIERISVEDARVEVEAGRALLVCSYEDDKCRSKLLEGSMVRGDFEKRLPSLPKDQEIIFYCG